MSLPVSQHRLHGPANESDRARVASPPPPGKAAHAHRHSSRLRREQLLDEELAASFPASDPPSWVHGADPALE